MEELGVWTDCSVILSGWVVLMEGVGCGEQHHHHKNPEFTAVSWNTKTFSLILPFSFLSPSCSLSYFCLVLFFCCTVQVFMLQTISECYDILKLPAWRLLTGLNEPVIFLISFLIVLPLGGLPLLLILNSFSLACLLNIAVSFSLLDSWSLSWLFNGCAALLCMQCCW